MKVNVIGEKKLTIMISDFWEQSVKGFGSYSKEISKSVYYKHIENNSKYIDDKNYEVNFEAIGSSFFVFITDKS